MPPPSPRLLQPESGDAFEGLDDLMGTVLRSRAGLRERASKLLCPPQHLQGVDQLLFCVAFAKDLPVTLMSSSVLRSTLDTLRRDMHLPLAGRDAAGIATALAMALGGPGVVVVDSVTDAVHASGEQEPALLLHRCVLRGHAPRNGSGGRWELVLSQQGDWRLARSEALACADFIVKRHSEKKR
jgi:hypothetical protein